MSDTNPITGIEDGHALAQAIVDTVREPLLVLDKDLRVVAASRSFYLTFKADRQDVAGPSDLRVGRRPMGHPGAEDAVGESPAEAYGDGGLRGRARVSRIGRRIMLLNAANGVRRGASPIADSSGDRRYHRAARHRAGDWRIC